MCAQKRNHQTIEIDDNVKGSRGSLCFRSKCTHEGLFWPDTLDGSCTKWPPRGFSKIDICTTCPHITLKLQNIPTTLLGCQKHAVCILFITFSCIRKLHNSTNILIAVNQVFSLLLVLTLTIIIIMISPWSSRSSKSWSPGGSPTCAGRCSPWHSLSSPPSPWSSWWSPSWSPGGSSTCAGRCSPWSLLRGTWPPLHLCCWPGTHPAACICVFCICVFCIFVFPCILDRLCHTGQGAGFKGSFSCRSGGQHCKSS